MFLIQNRVALPHGGPVGVLHLFKLHGQQRALQGYYILLSCFLSHVVTLLPNHVVKPQHEQPCLGFNPPRGSSSETPFLTPPTLDYLCQESAFSCLSRLPLLVQASMAL